MDEVFARLLEHMSINDAWNTLVALEHTKAQRTWGYRFVASKLVTTMPTLAPEALDVRLCPRTPS